MKKHATTDKPLIVFATIAAGGGHVATANAMAQSLGAGYPDTFDTRVTELMVELGFGEQDQKHKNTWSWMLAHPWSARWGQRIIDRLPKLTNRYLRGTLDAFARAAADHLNSLSPALVVTNHGWLTIALTLAQERYGLKPKLVHFATDPLDASALWAEWRVSRYIVPSASVQRDLKRFGVPPGVIDRIGYPVGQTFLNPPSQAAAREKLGLEPRYTCLVSLGGEGVGANVLAVVRALEASPLNPQIVVVTGRNEALRRKLDALPDIRTLGYVSNVADYLAACRRSGRQGRTGIGARGARRRSPGADDELRRTQRGEARALRYSEGSGSSRPPCRRSGGTARALRAARGPRAGRQGERGSTFARDDHRVRGLPERCRMARFSRHTDKIAWASLRRPEPVRCGQAGLSPVFSYTQSLCKVSII